ncbi:histone-lysine N-methyltransferase PRDM9-like isoform X2 [Cynoglossus semilaevis]|nr:histone-lysine N-methyltransferase PRDM9-like isoform X2 [Cynoglossus semilaevis]
MAGIGVINHGPSVCPGMHFGPYEGEVTTCEGALTSDLSWEIYKGELGYKYIDAAKDSHSNWMRYVRFARNKNEANLLAVQYKDSIFFHCCRSINPGDELMVWPSDKLLADFSESWTQIWFMRLKSAESSHTETSQVLLCSHCELSFTTEAFLQRHIEKSHPPPTGDCAPPVSHGSESENPTPTVESATSVESMVVLSVDPVDCKTCEDCGKTFKQMPHLRRHKLCVHSNKRPYCCQTCRRTFSQASGLIRHELVHRKQTGTKVTKQSQTVIETNNTCTQRSKVLQTAETSSPEEPKENTAQENQEEGDVTETEEAKTPDDNSSDSVETIRNKAYTKKPGVHEKVRPYVCSVCQRCFGQYHDLNRHLQVHRKERKRKTKGAEATDEPEPDTNLFNCAPSEETLQQHISERNSEDSAETNQNPLTAHAESDHSDDPDFIPQPSVTKTVESVQNSSSQRPQRLRARSRISAITKLIAPKQRATVSKKPKTEQRCAQKSPTASVRNVRFRKYKWFGCDRCKRTYGNQEDLKSHKCALKQLKCGQCGAAFSKSGFLKRHEQKVHSTTQSYGCDHCGKVFPTACKLKQHQKNKACMKYHCNSELFSCSFCQFSFTMKNYLIKHVKRHHPVEYLSLCDSDSMTVQLQEEQSEKQYVCPNCGKSCSTAKAFKSHTCFQQVKVLYLCTDCGKGFMNHYTLKQHQRIHTGEKPHSCPHCSKSFTYTCQLNVHLRTHTGEKPYLCTHCGESFRQSGDLKRHERKHTGVKPYPCHECGKSFSRPHSLKAHQMLHMGEKMFKCTECGKSFSRNYHLRRHHQKMHL